MLESTRRELQWLEWKDQNGNVWNDKKTTAVFEMIRPEFQYLEGSELRCLEGYGQNSNVWKNKNWIPMFERIGQEI